MQFAPFMSAVDAGFWYNLTDRKLNEWKLDETQKELNGTYSNSHQAGLPCHFNVEFTAFEKECKVPYGCCAALGTLINTNTLDNFKSLGKQAILDSLGKKIWDSIVSKEAIHKPMLLNRFLMLTFADLKKYKYYYWFAFPAISLAIESANKSDFSHHFNKTMTESLLKGYDGLQDKSYFIVIQNGDSDCKVCSLEDGLNYLEGGSLQEIQLTVYFAFCDPSILDAHAGWPLRNYLALIAYHWRNKLDRVNVLCFRDRMSKGVREVQHSIVFDIKLSSGEFSKEEIPKVVGWEKNERQKLGPRLVDLSATMDPNKLAESSVDLNLRLMRWRVLPTLDLDKISSTKCLLLGAGTLGCNVARCLLGWGVRHITFVDNSSVSYSNPVRQTLFTFEDSLNGGKSKAEAAANSLHLIFPGVVSRGVVLNIPMPGHPISEAFLEQTREDVEVLEKLVDEHDVVFLLMDTRESRWLPTVIGTSKGKLVVNAALGFDTFMVVRHGLKSGKEEEGETVTPGASALSSRGISGDRLGCYFCNDVVAPGNSTRDRTLDQQCTVSRPGMSMIAGALAVELLVSILQHPLGGLAPADTSAHDDHLTEDTESPLGIIPHQIRGFLSRFHNVLPASLAFDKCTACSKIVLSCYKGEGFEFLRKAFDKPSFLEDLTGLTELHQATQCAEVWDYSDSESV